MALQYMYMEWTTKKRHNLCPVSICTCMHSCNQHPDNKYTCLQINQWVSWLRYVLANMRAEIHTMHCGSYNIWYWTTLVPNTCIYPCNISKCLRLKTLFECMCICCLDVDCMNAYMIIMSPDDSPHGVYCLCPYVSTYVCVCGFLWSLYL